MPVDESLIVPTRFSLESGKEEAGKLLDRNAPTAIFAFNDVLACAAIQAARIRGIDIASATSANRSYQKSKDSLALAFSLFI